MEWKNNLGEQMAITDSILTNSRDCVKCVPHSSVSMILMGNCLLLINMCYFGKITCLDEVKLVGAPVNFRNTK